MGDASALQSSWGSRSTPELTVVDGNMDMYQSQSSVTSFRGVVDIPADILCNIFRFCLPQDCDHPLVVDPKTAPLILSQICSRWRDVVTGFPEFWSKIWVRIVCDEAFEVLPKNGHSQLNLTKLWLNRANGHPISVSLVIQCIDNTSQSLVHDEIYRILLPIVPQLRTLHINSRPHTTFGQLPVAVLKLASQLQNLHFHSERPLYPIPIRCFGSLPSLRRVAINVFDDDPALISLPWGNLTDLDIGGTGIEADKCRHILRQCHRLKAVKLLIHTRRPIVPPAGAPIALTLLDRLVVFFDGQYDTSFFLNIELPSLSHLELGSELAEIEWLNSSPISVDYRRLQSLTLTRVDISTDTLLRILHSASSIRHLALNFYRTDASTFLHSLQNSSSSSTLAPVLLPCLLSLILYTEHLVLSEKPYVDAILSRFRPPLNSGIAILQKVSLMFLDFGWIEAGLRSQFVQAQVEGLDITIEESFVGIVYPAEAAWDSFSPKYG